ncbi:MAG: hypothetical protein U1E76_19005 [Planctomycetota bacterium]
MKPQTQRHQLQVAGEIQESLFPKTLPEIAGYQVEAAYHPATDVGGDYYEGHW